MKMAEYVERKALIDAIDKTDWYHVNVQGRLTPGAAHEDEALYKAADIYNAVDKTPVADVAEIKRVQWRVKYEKSGKLKYVCPACKYVQRTETWAPLKWNYCPNCGARIGKRRDDEAD